MRLPLGRGSPWVDWGQIGVKDLPDGESGCREDVWSRFQPTFRLQTLREERRACDTFLWPVWAWWGRSEGVVGRLQKGSLAEQKRNLERRKEDRQKRLSALCDGLAPPKGPSSAPPSGASEGRQILTEQRRLEHEERTLGRAGEIRVKARERFINVIYVEDILQSLLSPEALLRLGDPLASATAAWHRLCHLLGDPGLESPLPYDPSQPPPTLESAPADVLHIPAGYRVYPWIECFAFWMRGSTPSAPPPVDGDRTRPTLEPLVSEREVHWRLVKEVFGLLCRLNSANRNGIAS